MSTVETLSIDLVKIITEYVKESKIYLCKLVISRTSRPYDTEYFKSEDGAIEYGIKKWKETMLSSGFMKPTIKKYKDSVEIFFSVQGETHQFFVIIEPIMIKD